MASAALGGQHKAQPPSSSVLFVVDEAELTRLRKEAASTATTAVDARLLQDARARHDRRLQLKQKSDERMSRWRDTIEAKQEKKLRWKEERREEAERQRIDIDAEEEALEAAEKQETLARTQALLLEQTDAMKSLRSAQRYAAILKTLEQQTAERQAQCAAIEEERKAFRRQMLAQQAEADAQEQARRRARFEDAQAIAGSRRAAMAEARARNEEAHQAKQQERLALLAKAQEEAAEEKKKAAEQQQRCRADHEAMLRGNAHLQEYKAELRRQEAQEAAKIAMEVEAIDARERARKERQEARFAARQQLRQQMIDRACEQLAKKVNNEQAILERQIQQQRDKEEKEVARRAELQRRERQAIAGDMILQRQQREEARRQEREEMRRRMEAWAKENEAAATREREAAEAHFRRNVEVRRHIERQVQEMAAQRAAERASRLQPRGTADDDEKERARFLEIAGRAIAQAEADGTPTYPLRRAIYAALHPAPLPAPFEPKPPRPSDAKGGSSSGTSSSSSSKKGARKAKVDQQPKTPPSAG